MRFLDVVRRVDSETAQIHSVVKGREVLRVKDEPREDARDIIQTHILVKGDNASLEDEVFKFQTAPIPAVDENKRESMRQTVDYLSSHLGEMCYAPISYREVVENKKKQASPGEPWSNYATTYGGLIELVMKNQDCEEGEALDYMAEYVEQVEKAIVDGDWDYVEDRFTFLVHSKEDKYKPNKIMAEAYRSIQACDWVFQCLCERYIGYWASKFKSNIPEVAVKSQGFCWHNDVGEPMSQRYTFATDISAFDRGVPAWVTSDMIQYLRGVCGIPERLATVISRTLIFGDLVLPGGNVMERWGGNASGQFLTTEVNCFFHFLMCVDAYSVILKKTPAEVVQMMRDGIIVLRIVGDDELLGGSKEIVEVLAQHAAEVIKERWGYEVKYEEWKDSEGVKQRVWPPGFHAPFLDSTSIKIRDRWVDIALRPYRRMASLTIEPEKGVDYRSVVDGVFESLKGWVVLLSEGRPVMPCIKQLVLLSQKYSVGRSALRIMRETYLSDAY